MHTRDPRRLGPDATRSEQRHLTHAIQRLPTHDQPEQLRGNAEYWVLVLPSLAV